jgi:elongator complex protein 3
MRELGATKIELGIQTIYNDILKLNKRGHDIETSIKATRLLKNAGFKVAYQIMLNLPGSSPKKDIQMLKNYLIMIILSQTILKYILAL